MSDVRMLKYGFFLQRLVENSVQKEYVQKKLSEFIRLPLIPVLPEALIFRKNLFFLYFSKIKSN